MVRTKADAAVRVAAGAKAPKKTASRYSSPSRSPTEKVGKDNLPVNRYCPRETPAWQKKITFFYEKKDEEIKSPEKETVAEETSISRSKRSRSEFDDSDEMISNGNEISLKKIKRNNNMETGVEESTENDANDSMEMDE